MNVHETKSNFLGQQSIKYALFDPAVRFARSYKSAVLETKLLGAQARFMGLEGNIKPCQQICLNLLPATLALKASANLYVIYSMLGTG